MTPSFWDHLDELRSVLIRCAVAWLGCAVVMFCLRDSLFAFLFAPSQPDFVLFRWLNGLESLSGMKRVEPQFINTELAAQFTTHLEVASLAGLVVAFPYVFWQLYGFVSPAMYDSEKRAAGWIVSAGTVLFVIGVALNYLIIFPFAFRFLSTYQVQAQVVNQVALTSYTSTLLILSLIMGLLFEMPLVAKALAKAGLLEADFLRRYRRHALVALTILAAVITPTGDAIALLLVTLPLYLLYELSIAII